jgi:hypothetical protein
VNALAALEDGVADTCGDQALALRGVILAYPVPQVLSPNAFTNRRLLCLKHWRNQPRLAGFGDRAAGRHQHAGTEDAEDSQGEAPRNRNPSVIRTTCDPFIETK